MKVVKAIAVAEPWASQIAAGAINTAYKSFRTPHRGEILIISDEEPWYGLALAELVDVLPITKEMNAPLLRGYAWSLRNVVRVTRFITSRRTGLFTAEIPEGALPSALQTAASALDAPSPPAAEESIKVALACDLRMARAGLRRATAGFRHLVAQAARGEDPATLGQFAATAQEILNSTEDLATDMVRLDAVWCRELAPPTADTDVIARLGSSDFPTTWRRSRLDILVVEDEPKMARGVQRSLSTDHDVRIASSKAEALAQIRQRVPDVLLCDHRLEWQKTDDLFEYVRDNHPRVRRVLYSFSQLEVWNDLLHRKVVDAVVPKSAPRNALLAALF